MKYIIEGIALADNPKMRGHVEERVKDAGITFPCEVLCYNGEICFAGEKYRVLMPLSFFRYKTKRDEWHKWIEILIHPKEI